MIITPSTTVQSGAFPRAWVPAQTASPPQELRDDAALLAQASGLCAKSYKLNAQTFVTDSELDWASYRRGFGREKGRLLWRPLALVLMPFNFVAILVWFVALLVPLLAVGALTEALWYRQTGMWVHLFTFTLTTIPTWLFWLGLFVGGDGLVVGAIVAGRPRTASGRAFCLVDTETKRAIVVFCGSDKSDNLTINALIWPYFLPMRHMGFNRAWDHIRPGVRQWLQQVIGEGHANEVVITGHSLGGALAQIAGYDLAAEFPVGHVISLGSACIGGPGMMKRYAAREVSGGGRLPERTRHFTYTGDVMPRIPPISVFRQVGRRFCLPESGAPIEGTEEGVFKSFGRFFLKTMSTYARFVLKTMTRFRTAIMRLLISNYKEEVDPAAPDGERVMSVQEALSAVPKFLLIFPPAIPYAAAVAAIALTLFPITALLTMYAYYYSVFKSGLKVQHAAANYRNAFRRHLATFDAVGGGEAPAAAASS